MGAPSGRRPRLLLGLLWLCALAPGARARAQEVALIAHPSFPVASVSFAELAAVARGELEQIGGTRVTLLIPPRGTAARAVVLRRVYGMSESAFQQFWISRILRTGGEVPKGVTAAQAGRLVERIPGALALVAAADLSPGARVLAVDGRRPGDPRYALAP